MDFTGMRLIHKSFGEGVVEAVSNSGAKKIISVVFAEKTVRLVYPDIFEQAIVTAAEPSVQTAIMAEIEKEKKTAAEERERRLEQKRQAEATISAKPGKTAKPATPDPVETVSADSPLTAGKKYGTASNRIYEACMKAYGFAEEGLKEFGWNNHMYAKGVTKEGYSVWMLAHSNWTDTKNEKWRNTISEGFRLITEDWGENAAGLDKELPDEIRVTFAKDGAGAYVFLGVFRCTTIDPASRIKKYELVSDRYPTE